MWKNLLAALLMVVLTVALLYPICKGFAAGFGAPAVTWSDRATARNVARFFILTGVGLMAGTVGIFYFTMSFFTATPPVPRIVDVLGRNLPSIICIGFLFGTAILAFGVVLGLRASSQR